MFFEEYIPFAIEKTNSTTTTNPHSFSVLKNRVLVKPSLF